jgi:hypothetical protein
MIVENEAANQRWLRQIHEIIERVRLTLSDYSRVAAEEDPNYQDYSPFLNRSMYDTASVEFDLGEELPLPAKQVSVSTKALRWLGIRTKEKVNENLDAWKWALIEKRKFETVLSVLQDENRRLKDLLPLMSTQTSTRVAYQGSDQHSHASFDEDLHRLGLATHAQLKRILMSGGHGMDTAILSTDLKPILNQPSNTLTVCLFDNSKHDVVLVEYKHYEVNPEGDEEEERQLQYQRARQLALLLSSAGVGDLATLAFRGISEEHQHKRHAFVFDFPGGTDTAEAPLTLFQMIDSNKVDVRLTLANRFQAAATLAKALAAFHSDGWVHKSLRSDSVVFFREALTKNLMVKNPYLVNFEYSRPQASHTKLDFDDDPERNLYRHPDRQGEPRTSFTRLHDIYALGVVLLEIGLWQTVSSMVKEVKVPSGRRKSVQEILKQLTKRRLAHHMGEKYMEAVLSCLDDRFEHRITDVDFSMIFHDEVVQKINVRALLDAHVY